MKMKGKIGILLKRVASPKWPLLLLFGCVAFPLLLGYFWRFSFSWFISPYHYYLPLTVGAMILTAVIYVAIDQRAKTSLYKYGVVASGILVLLLVVWPFAADFLHEQSKKRAMTLVERIEKYKGEKGEYPIDLDNSYFVNSPRRSLVGTHYMYKYRSKENTYSLEFFSFGGYWVGFNPERQEWYGYD